SSSSSSSSITRDGDQSGDVTRNNARSDGGQVTENSYNAVIAARAAVPPRNKRSPSISQNSPSIGLAATFHPVLPQNVPLYPVSGAMPLVPSAAASDAHQQQLGFVSYKTVLPQQQTPPVNSSLPDNSNGMNVIVGKNTVPVEFNNVIQPPAGLATSQKISTPSSLTNKLRIQVGSNSNTPRPASSFTFSLPKHIKLGRTYNSSDEDADADADQHRDSESDENDDHSTQSDTENGKSKIDSDITSTIAVPSKENNIKENHNEDVEIPDMDDMESPVVEEISEAQDTGITNRDGEEDKEQYIKNIVGNGSQVDADSSTKLAIVDKPNVDSTDYSESEEDKEPTMETQETPIETDEVDEENSEEVISENNEESSSDSEDDAKEVESKPEVLSSPSRTNAVDLIDVDSTSDSETSSESESESGGSSTEYSDSSDEESSDDEPLSQRTPKKMINESTTVTPVKVTPVKVTPV
ncbi:MAG: hypothetical protein M5F18_09395, partial [Asgard group archaeon]|nr:hypothetical protein [Asgard group archaeon]